RTQRRNPRQHTESKNLPAFVRIPFQSNSARRDQISHDESMNEQGGNTCDKLPFHDRDDPPTLTPSDNNHSGIGHNGLAGQNGVHQTVTLISLFHADEILLNQSDPNNQSADA